VAHTGAVAIITRGAAGYATHHEPDYHAMRPQDEIVARVFDAEEPTVTVYATPTPDDPEATAREDADVTAPLSELADDEHIETRPEATTAEALTALHYLQADDAEIQARAKLLTTPLDCAQPAITTPQAEAQVISRAFGTRPPRPLKPAKQDSLFNPIPQLTLFSGGR
jgi:hypothetical protein